MSFPIKTEFQVSEAVGRPATKKSNKQHQHLSHHLTATMKKTQTVTAKEVAFSDLTRSQ